MVSKADAFSLSSDSMALELVIQVDSSFGSILYEV